MSRNLESAHRALEKWYEDGKVGNLIFYRAPSMDGVDCLIEEVIKSREMDPGIAAAFALFMNDLGVERGEIHRNSNGDPDRVKLTRSYDE